MKFATIWSRVSNLDFEIQIPGPGPGLDDDRRPFPTITLNMKADTPSDEDLKQWGALGGKQVTEKKRAVYIAPSGKQMRICCV